METLEKKIYIKLTNDCSLNCKHCYNRYIESTFPKQEEIPPKVFVDAVNNYLIKYMKYWKKKTKGDVIFNISFHGGEPFLNETTCDMMSAILGRLRFESKFADYFYAVDATTNLLPSDPNLFKTRVLPIIMEYFRFEFSPFIKTSWDFGDIRFHSKEAEKTWVENMLLCADNGVYTKVNICLTKPLIDYRKYTNTNFGAFLYILAYSARINEIHFEPLTANTTEDKSLIPTYEEIDNFLLDLYEMKDEFKSINLEIDNFSDYREMLHGNFLGCRGRECTANVITIDRDLNIYTCPNTTDCIGNVIHKPVYTARKNGSIYKQEHTPKERCLSCEYYKYCNGGCFQLSDDSEGNCPFYKKLFQAIYDDEKRNGNI